ncbi:MAG TPA: transcription-repair coupling factor [Candidatus Omnitrophota bacterium]|nr:transcription-repair coupling factor [Candidatus Omnitrophota bacterium]HQO58091.1 transcription-repair coupling factor [Candidatus Omnitrophota bacterium]HQP12044.1 transcription-repair coupling factor [Candidatus Omnitrophota bacterium]
MFRSLKLYVDQTIHLDEILDELVLFHYRKARDVQGEGDFACRGEVLDIFPVNFDSPIRIALNEDRIQFIASYNIRSSQTIWKHNIVFILPRKKTKKSPFTADTPLNHFVDIRQGDYVVHNHHGIGRFLGIKPMSVNNQNKDHLVIEYSGGDRLYIPQHDMHLVQKYISFHKKPPRLYKLGSREWTRVKAHIQKKLQRFAAELLRLQALRTSLKGFAFNKDSEWESEFAKSFPFTETPDQTKSTQEVKADMEADWPMDRLLCGDVGFGKTEVALRAMFKAVLNNKQVAVLVPTTILAEQHYYNFRERMKNYPVEVAMLSRFRTRNEQEATIRDLAEKRVDIVIGTHRLLSQDIGFKDLGLVVIDEEQRFGVKAKEKLKHLKLLVDVLTLTATPIPRTLYMAMAGVKDMSVISTPPKNRTPVLTHIVEFDEDLVRTAIEREMSRKGQVFFLHNRVEDIEKIAKIIQRLAPQARIAVGHGQMPARQLEHVMLQFLKGEIDVLVCTTIIESGIDIPNANTLMVNHAHHFGLADLHQLRGRVGRFTSQAYAYFFIPSELALSKISKARLSALEKHSELGAGFQIAFEDLQIRGAGNLLGEEQSGYITAIGFDLYCRLLKESIEHLKTNQETTGHGQTK